MITERHCYERYDSVGQSRVNQDRAAWGRDAACIILLELGSLALFIYSIAVSNSYGGHPAWPLFFAGLLGMILAVILMPGFFTLQPNEARVLLLFGRYKGTVRESGFHWGNPFYANGGKLQFRVNARKEEPAEAQFSTRRQPRNKISLRARNLNSDKLKVNDKRGNPIEIGAVIVWRVHDTAQAMFDVDDYETYVRIQSESAIRHLASAYAYDHGEENEITLAQRCGRSLTGLEARNCRNGWPKRA